MGFVVFFEARKRYGVGRGRQILIGNNFILSIFSISIVGLAYITLFLHQLKYSLLPIISKLKIVVTIHNLISYADMNKVVRSINRSRVAIHAINFLFHILLIK